MMIAVTDLHVISVQIKNNIIALFQPPLPPWILITCRPSSQANSHYHPQCRIYPPFVCLLLAPICPIILYLSSLSPIISKKKRVRVQPDTSSRSLAPYIA